MTVCGLTVSVWAKPLLPLGELARAGPSTPIPLGPRPQRTSPSATRRMMTARRWWLPVAALLLLAAAAVAQECATAADGSHTCDRHERCAVWAAEGECLRSRAYMREHCPVACRGSEQTGAGTDAPAGRRAQEEEEDPAPDGCRDMHERCGLWAQAGECEANPKDMGRYCRRACKLCGAAENATATEASAPKADCQDQHELCSFWAKAGECQANPGYMTANCAVSCGTCDQLRAEQRKLEGAESTQVFPSDVDPQVANDIMDLSTAFGLRQVAAGADAKATLQTIQDAIQYMRDEKTLALPPTILENCSNKHEMCAFWAAAGECEANQAFMTVNCAPSCKTCNLIDIKARCPPLENAVPALGPGDLQKMFERIVATAPGNKTLSDEERRHLEKTQTPIYTVHVHSFPGEPVTEVSAVLDKSLPPWVVTFDNFLTPEECDALIQLGYRYGYKRSEDVGGQRFDGTFESVTNNRRTSENAWCSDHGGCRSEEIAQKIHQRMAMVMGIPAENSEDLQLLRYEQGQFYRTHHDYIPHQFDRQCGPRILTFFLYLSDVEAGGGTNFPNLDITVMPKKGRALLWPSVLNSNPMKKDARFMHQALDVEAGVKYAANGWIHMYDYLTPQKTGCT